MRRTNCALISKNVQELIEILRTPTWGLFAIEDVFLDHIETARPFSIIPVVILS